MASLPHQQSQRLDRVVVHLALRALRALEELTLGGSQELQVQRLQVLQQPMEALHLALRLELLQLHRVQLGSSFGPLPMGYQRR